MPPRRRRLVLALLVSALAIGGTASVTAIRDDGKGDAGGATSDVSAAKRVDDAPTTTATTIALPDTTTTSTTASTTTIETVPAPLPPAMPTVESAPDVLDPSPPPRHQLRFGLSTEGNGRRASELDEREQALGTHLDLVAWFADWTEPYPADVVREVVARGSTPVVYWEPWNHAAGADQPDYAMSAVAAGVHDEYLAQWAQDAAAANHELWLVLAPEMNTRWVPWGVDANGNTTDDVVAAWQHVRAVFASAGAANVRFLWAPARTSAETTPLSSVFPGLSDVDLVGVTLFNGGAALPWGGWLSFDALYAQTRRELAQLAPGRPVVLASTGSTEAGGDKSAWVNEMFDTVDADVGVTAVIWFDHDKETNWRTDSSPGSQAAFVARLANRSR